MQAHESFFPRFRETVVHGETLAAPVHGRAEAANLTTDVATGLVFPFPAFLEKLLASQVMAVLAQGFEATLHQHLRGDAGVVGARLPKGVAALHAPEPDQENGGRSGRERGWQDL